MALSDIDAVRLLIGDTVNSPFYPLFADDEIEYFLLVNYNNVRSAARMAAISAAFQLSGWSTRERTGQIEVWSSLAVQYLKALDYFINNPADSIPNGLMPWMGGISKSEVCENDKNPDVIQSPLNMSLDCETVCGCATDLKF